MLSHLNVELSRTAAYAHGISERGRMKFDTIMTNLKEVSPKPPLQALISKNRSEESRKSCSRDDASVAASRTPSELSHLLIARRDVEK